jgi:hypothetical protein
MASRIELARPFDPAKLPTMTKDGRPIPRHVAGQRANALEKLFERRLLPAHPGLHFATIKAVSIAVASLDGGAGCRATLEELARMTYREKNTIALVCNYLERIGFQEKLRRRDCPDCWVGDSRTVVRLAFSISRALAEQLALDEVLDLVATGTRVPVPRLREPQPPHWTPPGRQQTLPFSQVGGYRSDDFPSSSARGATIRKTGT